MRPRSAEVDSGFSLIEVMLVVAVIGILAAVPSLLGGADDERLKKSIREVAGAFSFFVRSEAIRTGQI